MNRRSIWTGKGTLIVMLVFCGALLLTGGMFRNRLGELLLSYTENQTKRQAETLASQAGEKLGTELENLAYVASKIESSPDELDRLMPMLFNDLGVKQGLLAIDGKALYGEPIPVSQYSGIQTSFGAKAPSPLFRDRDSFLPVRFFAARISSMSSIVCIRYAPSGKGFPSVVTTTSEKCWLPPGKGMWSSPLRMKAWKISLLCRPVT
ncbi:MAG: hypothetical protein J6N99_09240 [Schwartzia sp.]|nr:hypothetical protein [Schwartzia sp. (in: firmicutes)]